MSGLLQITSNLIKQDPSESNSHITVSKSVAANKYLGASGLHSSTTMAATEWQGMTSY